jgi:hypothetical protein
MILLYQTFKLLFQTQNFISQLTFNKHLRLKENSSLTLCRDNLLISEYLKCLSPRFLEGWNITIK